MRLACPARPGPEPPGRWEGNPPGRLVASDCAVVSECAFKADLISPLKKDSDTTELETLSRKSCLLKKVPEAEAKDIFFVRENSGKDRFGARS